MNSAELILVPILAAFLGIPILTVFSLRDWAANRFYNPPRLAQQNWRLVGRSDSPRLVVIGGANNSPFC